MASLLAVGLVALLGVMLGAHSVAPWPWTPSLIWLPTALDSVGTYPLGDEFVAHWNGSQFVIAAINDGNRSVFESVPMMPFIAVSQDLSRFDQDGGSIRIEVILRKRSTRQTIQSVVGDESGKSIVLSGELSHWWHGFMLQYSMRFWAIPNMVGQIGFEIKVQYPDGSHYGVDSVHLIHQTTPMKQFFGFGQQFSYFNMRGRVVPILVREQGVGRGLQPLTMLANSMYNFAGGSWATTYAPVPHYITDTFESLVLDNSEVSFFDLRSTSHVDIVVKSFSMSGRLIHANSPLDMIERYTQFSGRMKPLPDWLMNGVVVGLQGGRAFVEKIVQALTVDRNAPIAAVWLQDWVGSRSAPWGQALWWNWESDKTLYPDWNGMVSALKSRGIRVLSYINPHMVDASAKPNSTRNLFMEALTNGYAVRNNDGSLYLSYLNASMIDLTNPAARQFYKEVIKNNLLSSGVSGWMCDFGEALPLDAQLYDGSSAGAYHNIYPYEWAQVNQDAIAEMDLLDEIVPFVRASFTRSPGNIRLMWLGDQLTTWDAFDGIKTAVLGMLTSGLSGFSLTHSDVGGYNAIDNGPFYYARSKELFLRWCELSSMTSVFRTHEGSSPTLNWQFYNDNETMAFLERSAQVYVAWKPYRMHLMQEAYESGYPVVRHTWLHFPSDPVVFSLSYQFMLGSDFIVAPVLDQSADSVSLYLPQGSWVHVWTQKIYGPGWQKINAPIGQVCVLYAEHSQWGANFSAKLSTMGLIPGTPHVRVY